MSTKITMIVEDLVYALEEHKIYFNKEDHSFITSMDALYSDSRNLTTKQERAAEVIWDKRLKGREDYTKWDTDNSIVFDGKLYAGILAKISLLYVDLGDDEQIFTDWERTFIEDIYVKYHPDNYTQKDRETFNPILSERQIEHVERIYEEVNK